MAGPADILRELHRLRRHAKDLQTEIERLPRTLKVYQGKVVRQEEALKQAQDGLKKLKVTLSEKEKDLKAKHQEIAKREKQRDENVGNKKEFDALQTEIAHGREACQLLEDEILVGLTKVDEQSTLLPELDKALKQAQHEVANFDQISKARQVELDGQLLTVLAHVKEVEATMAPEVRSLYERLAAVRGEDSMAAVQNRTCQSCYTGITAQQANELGQGKFATCKSCGRFLYLAEAAAASPA